jgi:Domain of unknown function (DUF222)
LWFAAAVAKRFDHALGYGGLARRIGSATPAVFIQSLTGSSIEEATRLAQLGQSMVDVEVSGLERSPVSTAALSGGISVDAGDAIRRGLGAPDEAVTAAQLDAVADQLIARGGTMTPEALLTVARHARTDLDLNAIKRGEKQRSRIRYVRTWAREGMSGGSWAIPDEDGGLEIGNALKLLVANTTNGPRFATANTDSSTPSGTPSDTVAATTEATLRDERSPEQITADGFAQIFHNGLRNTSAAASAGSPAARNPPPGQKPTTSTTGHATPGPPTSPTASSSADTTTCSSTTPGGTPTTTTTAATG